jgi:glutathione S-transferase
VSQRRDASPARNATSIIILYGPRRAPFTEKVRRALLLKGLDFELREPSGPEDYRRWSPETGLLPVLEIDGERTADSTDILHWLDQLYPDPPLLSSDPKVAETQRQLEDWADESFLWYFLAFTRVRGRNRASGEATDEERARFALPAQLRFLRPVMAWFRSGGTWERPETALLRGLGDRLDDLVNFLGARPFFHSQRVSMADLAVYGMLYTIRLDAIPGAAGLLSQRPALLDFMRRLESDAGEQ